MVQSDDQSGLLFVGIAGCGTSIIKSLSPRMGKHNHFVAINDNEMALKKVHSVSNHILLKKRRMLDSDWDWLLKKAAGLKGVCIIAGLGGRLGTTLTPVVLKRLKDNGIITIVIVTMPFHFEQREDIAKDALQKLSIADYLITFPNNHLIKHAEKGKSMADMFTEQDEQILSLFQ